MSIDKVPPADLADHPPILPAGRLRVDDFWEWRSPDGTTVAWFVGFPEPAFRIWTGDPLRITRLRRLKRVEQYAYTVTGGPEAGFTVDRAKLETMALRRILWGRVQPGSDSEAIGRESAAELPVRTSAAVSES